MTWIDAVRRRTPRSLFPLARTLYHRLVAPFECAAVAATDRLRQRTYEGRVLPPAALRFKVRGTPSGDVFARVGRESARQIDEALRRSGRALGDYRSILDFGCGCGGTLPWVRDLAPQAALSGTDIDADAIAWCRSPPAGRVRRHQRGAAAAALSGCVLRPRLRALGVHAPRRGAAAAMARRTAPRRSRPAAPAS